MQSFSFTYKRTCSMHTSQCIHTWLKAEYTYAHACSQCIHAHTYTYAHAPLWLKAACMYNNVWIHTYIGTCKLTVYAWMQGC